jgi:ribosomal protein S17E
MENEYIPNTFPDEFTKIDWKTLKKEMREVLNIVSSRLMNFIKSAPIIDRRYETSSTNHGDLSMMTGQGGALFALYRYVLLLRKESGDG